MGGTLKPDGALLGVGDVADLLDVPERTVRNWRKRRYGPTPMRVGKFLKWRRADVDAWIEEQANAAS